jgi:hypothetical protein
VLGDAAMIYSAHDKLTAIDRELAYRRRVYPRLVANHQVTKQHADYQIAVLEAIAEDYRELEKKERLV